ncbi:DUF1254 domain-containing protein [Nocardioides rubriscoriae]|uniref:DUF1254 domain-containing protein n=1 Tax=Nocardioides rubriscoriae TaxID=642762 RepID=UPI0011E04983|nr:DUF1254 domain-containing protein [Nocardioides rubriscoriae]
MRRRSVAVALALVAPFLAATTSPAPASVPASVPVAVTAAVPPDPATALVLGQQAYDYGFPLLEFLRVRREETSVRCPDAVGNAPVNSFSHARRFADASFRDVVAVNTDTLYSIAQLDLGRGPVVLRHPDMGRRYYSFAMLDPFTNVIATPGTREDGGRAGAIQVRWSGNPGPRSAARDRGVTRVVTSAYRRVWVIGRTLATDRADQRRAYTLMKRYSLTLPDGTRRRFPDGCRPGAPEEHPTPTTGPAFVRRLNAALAHNPPPRRDRPLLERLRPYGIGPGLSPERAGLDPLTLRSLYAGIEAGAATLLTATKGDALATAVRHDGWYDPPDDIGDYGTDYRFRAQIAAAGLGANTRAEATYPVGVTDGHGVLYTGTHRYRLTFAPGELPPVRYFWSLTMYDADGYLVPNADDRYSVGPSHPPLVRRRDGSVVIAVQRTEPTGTRVNWLPAPSGQFRLNLRLYGPRRAVLTRRWTPPPVQDLGVSR